MPGLQKIQTVYVQIPPNKASCSKQYEGFILCWLEFSTLFYNVAVYQRSGKVTY